MFAITIGDFFIFDTKKIQIEEMEAFNSFFDEMYFKNTTYFMSQDKRFKKRHKYFKDEKDFEKNISYVILGFISEHNKRAAFQNKFQMFFMY